MSEDVVPEISPAELKERLEAGRPLQLVDVREHFERRIADLPDVGQTRLPVGELLRGLDGLDRRQPVVVYCRTGHRSEWAARLLLQRGFTSVLNLRGGVMGWRDEVDPTLQQY